MANAIYRRSLDEKLIENRKIAHVAAASVYAASRVEGEVRSLDEVSGVAVDSETSAKTKTIIQRVYAEMSRELELRTGPVEPEAFVPRFVNELGLDAEAENEAKELLNNFDDEKRSGKSPAGLAAGAVYSAALLERQRRTQREVAEVANVSLGTIRIRYQEILVEASDLNT